MGTKTAELATTRLLARVRYPDHNDPQGTSGEVRLKYDLAGRPRLFGVRQDFAHTWGRPYEGFCRCRG